MTSDFLILVNSIFYGLPSTTRQQKLFWSKASRVFFPSVNEGELQWSESRGASKPIHKPDQIRESVKRLTEEEQVVLVALLEVFYQHLLESGAENKRIIGKVVDSIKNLLTSELGEKAADQFKVFQESFTQFEARPTIAIPVLIWPLVVDFLMRCLTLFIFDTQSNVGKGVIMGINTTVIPVLIISIVYWVGNRDRKFNQNLLAQSGVSTYHVKFTTTLWQYTLATLFALIGSYIAFVLIGNFALVAIFMLPAYYFVYFRFFNVGRLTVNSVQEQLTRITSENEVLDADKNDEEIVKLETRLNSITSRLEAYVLESALFGALSFSGFLQIMSDNQITFDVLEKSAYYVYTISQGIILAQSELIASSLQHLNTKENLFCLLSFESLLCSILFLGVIASRLRFSNVSDRVQYSLNLSKAFNQKEEWLMESKEAVSSARFVEVNRKVNLYLQEGNTAMEEVQPVMALMQYLRNAGLLIFLIILISSGFLITPVIAACFLALSFLVWGYFERNKLQQDFQYTMLQLRASLVRFNIGLLIGLLMIMVVGLILRIRFHFSASITDPIVGVVILIIILYVFIWIVLYPHVDKNFGEIGSGASSQWRSNRWLLIKGPFAVLVVISIIGIVFKINNFRGADEQILVGLAGMSLMAYFLSFYLSKPWWMGIVPALVLSTMLTGALFKILHLAGANEMVTISLGALVFTIPIMILLRKRFHKLFMVTFFTILCILPLLLTTTLEKIGLAYRHAEWPVDRLILTKAYTRIWRYEDAPEERLTVLQKLVENGEWYLKSHGTRNGFTDLYERIVVNLEAAKEIAISEYNTSKNTTWLKTAEQGAILERKILDQFRYTKGGEEVDVEQLLLSELKLLEVSNKQKQLTPTLEDLLKKNYSPSISEQVMRVKNRLKE